MKTKIIFLAVALAALVSCGKETVERSGTKEKSIGFSTRATMSRGTVIADAMGLVPDGFDAWTYSHTAAWASATDAVILIDTGSGYANVTSTDGVEWDYGTPVSWPSDYVSSFAIAPHAPLGAVITPNPATHEAPTIQYTVPSAAALQQDFMIAAAQTDLTAHSYGGTIPEVFYHALSRIEIAARKGTDHLETDDEVIVTSITISNIYGRGTTMMETPVLWEEDDSSLTDYTLSVTGGGLTGAALATTDSNIVAAGSTMFLLPQGLTRTLAEDSGMMTVKFTVNGYSMQWKGALPGATQWEAAHPYKYTIVIDNEMVAIICAELDPPTTGGDWGTF